MSYDDEPDLEIGDIIRLGGHHWVYSGDKGRISEWKENLTCMRFKAHEHLRFKITGFEPYDGTKDVVLLKPINGAVTPGVLAPYGWDGTKDMSVSCVDVVLVRRP